MSMERATLELTITYSPGTGQVRVEDRWTVGGKPTSLALVLTANVTRQGREQLYREMNATVGQYLDILDSRWQEDPDVF